jgi:hypothetical protein
MRMLMYIPLPIEDLWYKSGLGAPLFFRIAALLVVAGGIATLANYVPTTPKTGNTFNIASGLMVCNSGNLILHFQFR